MFKVLRSTRRISHGLGGRAIVTIGMNHRCPMNSICNELVSDHHRMVHKQTVLHLAVMRPCMKDVQVNGWVTTFPLNPINSKSAPKVDRFGRSLFTAPTLQLLSSSSPAQQITQLQNKRAYGRDATTSGLNHDLNPSEAAKRKAKGKTAPTETIMLVSEKENISITTLVEAEKLARKKGLHLVEVAQSENKLHTEKKMYKLETPAQHFGEDWKKKHDASMQERCSSKDAGHRIKEEKTILLKSKITTHDIEAKVKQMNKLVEKGHPLRVFIGGGGDLEFIFNAVQKSLSSAAKIHQKKTSTTEIRFQILPTYTTEENSSGESTATDNPNTTKGADTTKPKSSSKSTKDEI